MLELDRFLRDLAILEALQHFLLLATCSCELSALSKQIECSKHRMLIRLMLAADGR